MDDKNQLIDRLSSYRGTGIGLNYNLNSYRAAKIKCLDDASGCNNEEITENNPSTFRHFISRFSRKSSVNDGKHSQERSKTPS